MRVGRPIRLLAAVVLAALAAPPAGAWPRPEVHGVVGRFPGRRRRRRGRLRVRRRGDVAGGPRWALGVEATAEDMGSDLETLLISAVLHVVAVHRY